MTDLSARSQILATTHSPTIADKIDINRIGRLARDPAGLSQEWRPEHLTETSAGRLSKYCDAKNSELIFASHVVLAEGGSDVGVIENFLKDSRDAQGISIIDMGGADHADHFVQLATRFQVPYLVVLDKDKYVRDRNTIKKISRVAGSPLTSSELDNLANLGSRRCGNYEQAAAVRDEANGILHSRGIFTLSADIEGGTVTSLRKSSVIEILGPGHIGHLTKRECEELEALSGARYRQRIWQLTGSKGWNSSATPEKGKPKPHVLPNLVEQATGKLRQRSDLLALQRELLGFVHSA